MTTLQKKLKIVESITAFSSKDTWNVYKDVISPIKSKIINDEITVLSVKYRDEFYEKYKPYTEDKNWGCNLDDFSIKLNSDLKGEITFYKVDSWTKMEDFIVTVEFNLPKNLLVLFEDYIEQEFYIKCSKIRQKELEKIEEDRIREIGKELLKIK